MAELLTFPFWLKVAYSAGLAFLVLVIAREGLRIWIDKTVYVGAFTNQSEGAAVQASSVPARTLQQHRLLRVMFEKERERRAKPVEGKGTQGEIGLVPDTTAPIDEHKTALADLQLKVQGFDLGELLKKLGNYVRPPHEIVGGYSKIGSTGALIVRWPEPLRRAPLLAGPELALTGLASEEAAAFALAAHIVYAQAAPGTDLQQHPPGEFADWLGLWLKVREVLDRAAPPAKADFDTGKPLQVALGEISGRLAVGADYPELFRLRAELLEVRAKVLGEPGDLAAAIADRLRYSDLLPPAPVQYSDLLPPPPAPPAASQGTPESPSAGPSAQTGYGRVWLTPGSYVTVTGIVVNGRQERFLVLPGYVGPVGTRLYRASADTQHVAEVSAWLTVQDQVGIALAALGAESPPPVPLADLPPKVSDTLTLLRFDGERVSALVAGVGKGPGGSPGPFVATSARVTGPGDGGAPVFDKERRLVAMAYAGEPEGSLLLPVVEVLRKNGFGVPATGG
jgi:hypothetical protein